MCIHGYKSAVEQYYYIYKTVYCGQQLFLYTRGRFASFSVWETMYISAYSGLLDAYTAAAIDCKCLGYLSV